MRVRQASHGSAPPLHCALCRLQLLQRIAFKHSPELRELALLNIGSIQVSTGPHLRRDSLAFAVCARIAPHR